MKKLFLLMCVCAGLYACSSDDDLVSSSSVATGSEGIAYLTVNIKDVNSSTRATEGGFAYGTTDEQTVNNAYFYLYDNDGKYIAYGSTGTIEGTTPTSNTNVEWNSNTTVAIWGLTDPNTPKMMLTVLNQPSSLNLQNKDFSDAVATLAGTPYGESGNFVMSTSVYGGTNEVVNYTALTEGNFALEPINIEEDYTSGDATPVEVYVERLAAKVSVSDAITTPTALTTGIYALSTELQENFPLGAPTASNSSAGGIGIQLLGYDVDAIARDAYLVKNIQDETTWSLSFIWNAAGSYRSYWAESPNYGDTETVYPTSSKGNTAKDEDDSSTWLNKYLRYVDLNNAVDLSTTDTPTYVYCGENTNTAAVLDSASNTGITNVLVKAQLVDYNPNNTESATTGIDLVEYHGEYYTADQFCQKTVDDVVDYDFTVVVDEVIAALKKDESFSSLSGYLDDLNEAIIKDHIYKSAANSNHKYGTGVSGPSSVSAFGGEMLSLYNVGDGNVDIFYNGAQPYWGESGTSDGTPVGSEIIAKYPASDIVYGGKDLDKYDFWFHVDGSALEAIERLGLQTLGLLYSGVKITDADGNETGETGYFMPIDNSISFTTLAAGDDSFSGGHVYTTRNFLLRTITVEADGIDTQFGSLYPNYYKDGLMYYHVPIEHLGTTTDDTLVEGEYGVVRNHWYDVTITSLNGLGRGIADKDEVIVPQPEIPYYYLGANINILSWHHLTQSVGW